MIVGFGRVRDAAWPAGPGAFPGQEEHDHLVAASLSGWQDGSFEERAWDFTSQDEDEDDVDLDEDVEDEDVDEDDEV